MTTDEARPGMESVHEELRRRDEAEREWLGAATVGRPTIAEAEALQQRGIPSCHLWEVPAGPPPAHLSPCDVLRKWQAGMCALCSGTQERQVIDHCHRTGLIRGMLCHGCNTAEGLSGATVYAAYRERPPAVMLGVTDQYGSPWDGFGAGSEVDMKERMVQHVDDGEALFADALKRFRR